MKMQANKKEDKPGVIYMIMCKCNNKVYIGESINYERRYQEHLKQLKCGLDNKYLQQDYNNFGLNSFVFKIIDTGATEKELLEKETYWINFYGGKDSSMVYNCRDIDGLNKEFAHKARTAFTGKTHTEDTKKNISNTHKGKYHMGELKYTSELVNQLRLEFKQLGSKRAVNELHPDINYISLCNLINYGCSQSINHNIHNQNYKNKGVCK